MHTAAMGRTQKQDRERGIDQQDIFYRVVLFLAAITRGLFSSVLGADNPPLGAVMGKKGDAGAVARGTGSSRIVKIFELAFPLEVTLLPSPALRLVFRSTLTHTQRQYDR